MSCPMKDGKCKPVADKPRGSDKYNEHAKKSVEQLKKELKNKGWKSSGCKSRLVRRLAGESKSAVADRHDRRRSKQEKKMPMKKNKRCLKSKYFREAKRVKPSDNAQRLRAHKVPELKKLLCKKKLKVSVKKDELIERIVSHVEARQK